MWRRLLEVGGGDAVDTLECEVQDLVCNGVMATGGMDLSGNPNRGGYNSPSGTWPGYEPEKWCWWWLSVLFPMVSQRPPGANLKTGNTVHPGTVALLLQGMHTIQS